MAELKVKCPNCGKVFIIADQQGIEKKTFTCSVCKTRSIIGPNLIVVKPKPASPVSEETQYGPAFCGSSTGEETQYKPSGASAAEETVFKSDIAAQKTAQLVDNFGRSYPLRVGINTIGRKANSSTASVQIAVEDRFMSRSHAIIEVRNAGGQFIYILKNGANQNPSYLNGTIVGASDQLILNNGDRLKFGYTELIFKK